MAAQTPPLLTATVRSVKPFWPVCSIYRTGGSSRPASSGDAKEMTAGQSVLAIEDFTRLPAHHVYASLVRENAVQPWASGVTKPAPAPTSDPADIRRRSRQRYGQPITEIEAAFTALVEGAATADGTDDIGAPRSRRRRA